MRKIIFYLLLILFCNSTHALIIKDITVSTVNTQDVNVRVKVWEGVVFNYVDSSYTISGNTITITACYFMTLLTSVWTLENDIIIPAINLNTNNYNLVVIVNYKNNQNLCATSIFSDTKSLSFSTPLANPVSLASNEFKNLVNSITPNPTIDNVNVSFGALQTKTKITLQNTLGQVVSNKTFTNMETINYPIEGESGIYFLSIENENGEKQTQKIIKK